MSRSFSPENIQLTDKIVSIIRSNPSGVEGDPALEALHWGQLIETIIAIDPGNIDNFVQFANEENARVEFQLIGLLTPFLMAIAVKERAFVAHYWLDELDTAHFEREMKKLEKKEKKK